MIDFDPTTFDRQIKGRVFEQFEPGMVITHHWGRTITDGDNSLFTTAMCNWNPMYLNSEYARVHGHSTVVVNPMLVLCTTVGLSVEDLTEAGGAFLGIDHCVFLAPVYPGDTITATSIVLRTRPSQSRPDHGVVTWETHAVNQRHTRVVEFERTNLVVRESARRR